MPDRPDPNDLDQGFVNALSPKPNVRLLNYQHAAHIFSAKSFQLAMDIAEMS